MSTSSLHTDRSSLKIYQRKDKTKRNNKPAKYSKLKNYHEKSTRFRDDESIEIDYSVMKDLIQEETRTLLQEKQELVKELEKAYKTIEWYKQELFSTKHKLKDTLVQLSQSQLTSTSATPASIAREHDEKIYFNDTNLKCKESIYKFNETTSSFSMSDHPSVYSENLNKSPEKCLTSETESIDTENSVGFEEMNYNSSGNNVQNFSKYSTKKHVFNKVPNLVNNKVQDYPLICQESDAISEKTQSLWCEDSDFGSENCEEQKDWGDPILRNSSAASLPAKEKNKKDDIQRCSSLAALLGTNKQPSQKERFVLNQYLYEIKEESDDKFKKFIEKLNIRQALKQEDVIIEEEEEHTKNIPMSMYSASRYESIHSQDSCPRVNIPHRTRSRNERVPENSQTETYELSQRGTFKEDIAKPFSRNRMGRKANPVFRTFQEDYLGQLE
ncbi:unnamed protein product [Moneuplotes crassus]|uniref:Uncharacterized protein n=1 Tax=Euplotes crassus TaxID=5936 RepID=A0AAD2D636_EUPCR|nr:unnamed protein product [Moneuplotes crassus]